MTERERNPYVISFGKIPTQYISRHLILPRRYLSAWMKRWKKRFIRKYGQSLRQKINGFCILSHKKTVCRQVNCLR